MFQVNLRSIGRKRFAHLSESLDEIHVDANVPWGEDTLFTLEFRADEGGKYALHTCNNKYLSAGGKVGSTQTFLLVYHIIIAYHIVSSGNLLLQLKIVQFSLIYIYDIQHISIKLP